ncbi:MAG: hypothetical protein PHN88_01525 [Ignavibacteria bacterium]|nr:hypothetical protein [Ignavibacteria bacterium]
MNTKEQINTQIKEYIAAQPEPKRGDMQELHRILCPSGACPPSRLEGFLLTVFSVRT